MRIRIAKLGIIMPLQTAFQVIKVSSSRGVGWQEEAESWRGDDVES